MALGQAYPLNIPRDLCVISIILVARRALTLKCKTGAYVWEKEVGWLTGKGGSCGGLGWGV